MPGTQRVLQHPSDAKLRAQMGADETTVAPVTNTFTPES